jgi:hypothetical protein
MLALLNKHLLDVDDLGYFPQMVRTDEEMLPLLNSLPS